jgi:hypothetical protein
MHENQIMSSGIAWQIICFDLILIKDNILKHSATGNLYILIEGGKNKTWKRQALITQQSKSMGHVIEILEATVE